MKTVPREREREREKEKGKLPEVSAGGGNRGAEGSECRGQRGAKLRSGRQREVAGEDVQEVQG